MRGFDASLQKSQTRPMTGLPIRLSLSSSLVLICLLSQAAMAQVSERHSERMTATAVGTQFEIFELGKPVLRYNYNTIEPGDLLTNISPANRIYARPRSDYIHPLYGLSGEELTRDWPFEHPHHRGIYWAWPEVSFSNTLGDLHALQKVFAHPTGKVKLQSGPVFAEIDAENLWLWEHRDPVVREIVCIRAYARDGGTRAVDLAFQFFALKDNVTIARRGADKYGGLNIRMAASNSQQITPFTAPSNAVPRRAWSDVSGQFPGAPGRSGLAVLQHQDNPDYPGDWIQYPELAWCQPTFPAAGRRYPLQKDKPLVLRYRLVIHGPATNLSASLSQMWDGFNAPATAPIQFPSFSETKAD